MTPDQNKAVRARTQELLFGTVRLHDETKPRNTQKHIGPSELGHCREYLRAKIADDPQVYIPATKWAAAVGSAVGDWLEEKMARLQGAMTQVPISYTLPRLGFTVHGSSDVLFPKRPNPGQEVGIGTHFDEVWDFKTKDGIDGVMREGPQRKEMVQISAYLLGGIDAGLLGEEAIGTLVYIDRSGKDSQCYTVSVTAREALGWIELAEERLDDVVKALADPAYGDGERHLRDEAEQTCWYFGCPFYTQCWADYVPSEKITDPRLNAAMQQYDDGRRMAKAAKKLQDEAKGILGVAEETPVVGKGERYTIDWKLRESYGVLVRQIDLRERRDLEPTP